MADCSWLVAVVADIGFFADLNGLEETSRSIDHLLSSLKRDQEAGELADGVVSLMQRMDKTRTESVNDLAVSNWERRTASLNSLGQALEVRPISCLTDRKSLC